MGYATKFSCLFTLSDWESAITADPLDGGFGNDTIDFIEEAKGFQQARKGAAMLVDQRDFVYHVNRKSKGPKAQIYWRCAVRNSCKASLVSVGTKITKFSGQHNHTPNLFWERKNKRT